MAASAPRELIHATCIARAEPGGPARGVLLRGAGQPNARRAAAATAPDKPRKTDGQQLLERPVFPGGVKRGVAANHQHASA